MTISAAFGSFIRPEYKLINTAVLTFALFAVQAILDSSFKCPTSNYNAVLAGFYSLSFYLGPAIIFLYVGLYYFPGFNKKECCPCWSGNWAFIYVVLKVGKAPVFWLLIAMTDGRYLSCFVVAASNYQLDHDLYLFIFQTSGMLVIILLITVIYYTSKCTCLCLEESRRTYSMLAEVEYILAQDKAEKERNEEKRKFLCALQHNGEYMENRIPKYMMDKEELITAKLNAPHAAHHENDN